MKTESGLHKGLCKILTELGLWVPGTKKQQDLQVTYQKDNFDPEKLVLILDYTVKSLGGRLKFVTKYYPEFNFIEMYWGCVNRKVGNECDYNWKILLENVLEVLESVPQIFVCMKFTKCCR